MAIAALLPLMLGAATSLPGVPSTPPSEAIVVTPDTVEVSPRRRWADVSLRNAGSTPREVRAGVLGWSQDDAGRVVLASAAEVSIFPGRAVLAPGEVRMFRLSTSGPAPDVERAYRIVIDVGDAASGEAVTALGPAFVAPATRTVSPQLSVGCGPRRCRVVVGNDGTVRVRPARISLSVRASGIHVERRLEPWWVLAGGARVYEVDLPAGTTSRREIVARATIDGRELEARAQIQD
jgi:hypothetical protein